MLGWKGGGDIPVVPEDPDGLKTVEPFYLFYARLLPCKDAGVFHGQTGKLNVEMKPLPVFSRLITAIRQFVQERYRI